MDFVDEKATFEKDGFVVVRPFLSPQDLTDLKAEVDRFMCNVLPDLPRDQAFYHKRQDGSTAIRQVHRMNCDPFFEAYRQDPRWIALAEALLGEPVRANTPMWFNKPPRTLHRTPPHQDNRYFHLVPPNAVMIFVALEPIDEENGCLRYVPGTHKMGVRPHAMSGVLGFSQGIIDFSADDREAAAKVELLPGEASCHHPEVIHWAEPNLSEIRARPAFAMVFEGESCRVDHAAFETYQKQATDWRALS